MPVLRVRVEHINQRLFRKAGDLLLYRLRIPDGVALGKGVIGLRWSRWSMMEERELLLRDAPIAN